MTSILLENLIKFYNKTENFNQLTDIINNNKKVSMRLIEWFVTVYAKENNRILHCNYKNMLKGLNKVNFDPYCRKVKGKETIFLFECNSGNCYTTIAQANFYKWIIEENIIGYINDDYDNIFNKFSSSKKLHKHVV